MNTFTYLYPSTLNPPFIYHPSFCWPKWPDQPLTTNPIFSSVADTPNLDRHLVSDSYTCLLTTPNSPILFQYRQVIRTKGRWKRKRNTERHIKKLYRGRNHLEEWNHSHSVEKWNNIILLVVDAVTPSLNHGLPFTTLTLIILVGIFGLVYHNQHINQ